MAAAIISPFKLPGRRSHRFQLPERVNLPYEILGIIFSHVSDRITLKSIARCCRRFYQLVAPTLFHSIYLKYSSTIIDRKIVKPTGTNDIRQLGLILLRRPDIAPFVHGVRLRGPTVDDYNYYDSLDSEIDSELHTAARQYLSRSKDLDTKLARTGISWLSFDTDDQTTPLVILLALLPKLTTLHIELPDDRLLAGSVLSLNVFYGIKNMTLEWIIPPNGVENPLSQARHVKQLLAIKTLDRITLINLAPYTQGDRRWTSIFDKLNHNGTGLCCATMLEIRRSRFLGQNHRALLAAFKTLQTLIYEHSYSSLLGHGQSQGTSILGSARAFHKDTLETLWLDFSLDNRRRYSAVYIHQNGQTSLRLLRDFSRLRMLCIPVEFVVRYDSETEWRSGLAQLPHTIEVLVLISHLNTWNNPVSEFMESFLDLLSEDRSTRDMQTDQPRVLPQLKSLVFIAHVDQFLHNLSALDKELNSVYGLEILLAHDVHHKVDEDLIDDAVTARIMEIEERMGLTRLGSCRWQGLSRRDLYRACCGYEVWRQKYGRMDQRSVLNTPARLRSLSQGTSYYGTARN